MSLASNENSSLERETERRLLAAAVDGDRQAFASVVEIHRERLFLAALAIVRNHEDAREISQETFVRVYQNLHRYDLNRPFYPWAYRILRNLCLDNLKKHGPKRKISLDSLIDDSHVQFSNASTSETSTPDNIRDNIYTREMVAHLKIAIDQLKPEFREIVVMKHFEEMAYKDIADALDIPIGTVMSRLFHARKALAELMKDHQP